VSALAGALAAGLASMTAHLTVGKKGYDSVQDRVLSLPAEAQSLKDDLLKAIDEDTNAFNAVLDAMRLPKKTEEQILIRDKEIESATQKACLIPLNVMKLSAKAYNLCKEMGEKGNENSRSDAEVGALMAKAAVHGAGKNVLINLEGIKDESFRLKMESDVSSWLKIVDV
ncbi:MAG TPA: glutamate formimidoyltransferase, partial [Candidatus Marinimicrobia bacterium]|nr:glutamate formimidoyltransferase [Candidatus Neomarinimicrobiota bacterium]